MQGTRWRVCIPCTALLAALVLLVCNGRESETVPLRLSTGVGARPRPSPELLARLATQHPDNPKWPRHAAQRRRLERTSSVVKQRDATMYVSSRSVNGSQAQYHHTVVVPHAEPARHEMPPGTGWEAFAKPLEAADFALPCMQPNKSGACVQPNLSHAWMATQNNTLESRLTEAFSDNATGDALSLTNEHAPADCLRGLGSHRNVVVRSASNGKYFSTFWGGGEVFAIGVAFRMPLDRMLFELKPATQSPWFSLRHRATNTTLAVLPRGAKEGANMVLARSAASGAMQDGDAHLFCFQRGGYLFSKASNGNVNQREQVLLRGHDNSGKNPAGRIPTARVDLLSVPDAAITADASAWKLRAHLAPTKLDKTPTLVPNNTSPVCGTQVRTDAESTSASPRLHVLTYATKATSMLCDSLRVAQRVNLKLVLLGWQEQYRGNFQKLEAAREYVARLPPDDLVLFADAYDVLYVADEREIVRRYLEMQVDPSRVLFQAEKGCWPDWDMAFGRAFCRERYPPSRTLYRYLNSGVWMGRAAPAFELLTEMVAFTPGLDDQHVVSHMFVDAPERFALDYEARLFQSFQEEKGAVTAVAASDTSLASVRNVATNSSPLVLHFNGGSKKHFPKFKSHLLQGAVSRQPLCLAPNASVCTPSGALSLAQICGMKFTGVACT